MVGHGGIQADMVLEKEWKLEHRNLLARRTELCHWVQLKHRRPQNPSLKGHTSSSKAISIPTQPHVILILLLEIHISAKPPLNLVVYTVEQFFFTNC